MQVGKGRVQRGCLRDVYGFGGREGDESLCAEDEQAGRKAYFDG